MISIENELTDPWMLGLRGAGEGIFPESFGPQAVRFLETLQASIDRDGVTSENAEPILAVARHIEHRSFDLVVNGHKEDWEKAREISGRLYKYRQQAHFICSFEKQGFDKAKMATLETLSSGYAVYLVRETAEKYGSKPLREWLSKLTRPVQRELDGILSQAAHHFWDQFMHKGWPFIYGWIDRVSEEQERSEAKSISDFNGAQLVPVNKMGVNNERPKRYNGQTVGERVFSLPEEVVRQLAEQKAYLDNCVDPETSAEAIRAVLSAQLAGYDGKPRRKPVRIQKVAKVFENENYGIVTADQLADEFSEGPKGPRSSINSRKAVTNTLSRLNNAFEELGLDVKIEGIHITAYRFCRRST